MHIPKKDIVKFFIKETLLQQKAHSQSELAEIINKKMKSGEYAVSGRRVRSIALEVPGVRIHAVTKRGKVPEQCPVCATHLKRIYSKNLMGDKLLLRVQCDGCGYSGNNEKSSPMKYEFEYRNFAR
jgi:hypothetical protein